MLSFWIDFLDVPDDIAAAVAARIERQRVLYQAGKRFVVLLEEQALRTWFGTAEVQAGQLGRLLEVMSIPTVSLWIIPMMTKRTAAASAGFSRPPSLSRRGSSALRLECEWPRCSTPARSMSSCWATRPRPRPISASPRTSPWAKSRCRPSVVPHYVADPAV